MLSKCFFKDGMYQLLDMVVKTSTCPYFCPIFFQYQLPPPMAQHIALPYGEAPTHGFQITVAGNVGTEVH